MFHKSQRKAVFCILLVIVTILKIWTKLYLNTLVIRSVEPTLQESVTFPSNNVPLAYMTQQEPQIRSRCFQYPQYVHLKFNNIQWQVLDGFRKQYFFYGAYFDNRYLFYWQLELAQKSNVATLSSPPNHRTLSVFSLHPTALCFTRLETCLNL